MELLLKRKAFLILFSFVISLLHIWFAWNLQQSSFLSFSFLFAPFILLFLLGYVLPVSLLSDLILTKAKKGNLLLSCLVFVIAIYILIFFMFGTRNLKLVCTIEGYGLIYWILDLQIKKHQKSKYPDSQPVSTLAYLFIAVAAFGLWLVLLPVLFAITFGT